MEAGFAGAVGVGFVVRDHDSFNRANLTIVNEHANSFQTEGERGIAHVDDTSRVEVGFTLFSTLVCGSSKERQAFLGESEHSVKVQRQDFGPSLVLNHNDENSITVKENSERGTYGVSVELVSPSGSSVIDQDVKSLLLGRNLGHELVDVREFLHVCNDWDAFSGTESVELFGGFFAVFGRSGRDVDLSQEARSAFSHKGQD
jgi:hypothetical protein